MVLNDIRNQTDLTDIYRLSHPNAKFYTFFSAAYGTLFNTDYTLWHKASLNRCKTVEITPCILSDYHGVKLLSMTETRESLQTHKTWETHYWIKTESRHKLRKKWKYF